MKEPENSVLIPDKMMITQNKCLFRGSHVASRIFVFSLLFMAVGCHAIYENGHELAESVRSDIPELNMQDFNKLTDGSSEFLLIDVRSTKEYQTANIPGSFHIPAGIIEFKIRDDAHWETEYMYTPMNEDTIVLYSQNGDRSALATRSLIKLGFKHALNLQGGWEAYTLLENKE
jgi:rhodanese-related sulfurtransferase